MNSTWWYGENVETKKLDRILTNLIEGKVSNYTISDFCQCPEVPGQRLPEIASLLLTLTSDAIKKSEQIRILLYAIIDYYPEAFTTEVLTKLLSDNPNTNWNWPARINFIRMLFHKGSREMKNLNLKRNPYLTLLSTKSRNEIAAYEKTKIEGLYENQHFHFVYILNTITMTYFKPDNKQKLIEMLLNLRTAAETNKGHYSALKRIPRELTRSIACLLQSQELKIIEEVEEYFLDLRNKWEARQIRLDEED